MHKEYGNKAKATVTKTIVKVLKIVGTALAIINGFIQPLSSLVYGELTDELMVPANTTNGTLNNNTGNNYESNKTNNELSSGIPEEKGLPQGKNLSNNLNLLNELVAGRSQNKTRIPTQLVLTPETNPLVPPGYGYPVMPGLVRLNPKKSEPKKKKNKSGVSGLVLEMKISKYALYYCYLALATFICSYGQMLSWNLASSSLFQKKNDNDSENQENNEEESEDGIGSRITIIIQNVANFASSMLVSFIQNWQLTLIMLAAGPIMASVMFYMNKLKSMVMDKVKFFLEKAKGVAKGAFSQVQTVATFGGQDFESNKFASQMLAADKAAKLRSIVDAVRAGMMIVVAFIFLGAGFWFSAGLILNGTLTPGAFISIFMAIISSVLKLVNVGDAVKVDDDKSKEKEEDGMFGKTSDESDQAPPENDIIGRILEQISNPEEIFKYYPSTPETMLKSHNEEHDETSYYIKFNDGKHCSEKFFNMTENIDVEETNHHDFSAKKMSFSAKFKEKLKSKLPKKGEKAGYTRLDSSENDLQGTSDKKDWSSTAIKERIQDFIMNTKSWFETKVLHQVKKRGLSLEAVKLQIKQLPLILLSMVGAVMTGMIAPGFSLLLSEILIVTADPQRLEAERFKWAFKFVDLGVFIAIGSTIQKFATSLTESRLEMGLQENSFNSAMNETKTPRTSSPVDSKTVSPVEENAMFVNELEGKPGQLQAGNLNKTEVNIDEHDVDSEKLKRQKEEKMSLVDEMSESQAEKMSDNIDIEASISKNSAFSITSLTSKVSGSISTFMTMFISFTNGWKMTLVVLAGLPIITYAQSIQDGEPEETTEEKEDSMITKVWKKIRGVTSSASSKLPSDYTSKYKDDCLKPYKYFMKLLVASGLAFAVAESVTFLVYAGALRYGGYLVRVGEMTVESVMTVLMTVLFGGAGSSNAPAEKTKTTKNNEELNEVKIDEKMDDDKLRIDDVNGDLEFHDVEFHHPDKKTTVMSGLNISVKPSETLAIIGTTDFNSNSLIALIERFYDPNNGYITLDNIDIRELDVTWLRSQTALVSEKAILNHHSIADNLLLGINLKDLSNSQVADILTDEHLKGFISSLSEIYYSSVNDDVAMSISSKQKLVIARALLRNPRLLIIDEFSQSDDVVEDSLKRLRLGKTCILFPRRLSTLEKADKIVIVYYGKVIEQGSKDELLRRRGIYYHLINTRLYSDVISAL